MTYTFGRQIPTGYYAYLNRKGTLIIGRQTFDGKCNIFSGSYSEAKERGLINRLAFDAPRIHRNIAEHYEDWSEISRPKVEDRVVRHEDFYEGDEEANRMGWQVMSVSSYYVNNPWSNKEYVGYTRLLRRVPRDINTDKVIYEES